MTAAKKTKPEAESLDALGSEVSLSALLSKTSEFKRFKLWIVGDTPLICHAWSHKAKREMLEKQVKATKPGKEARNPEADFMDSMYVMDKDKDGKPLSYGFPVTGFKKAFLSVAHKDKGVARTSTRQALWLDMEMVRTMPALGQAMCDMPLVRIFGSPPEMREDMGRIGSGLQKTANLIYRAQFTTWAVRITGKFNPAIIDAHKIVSLIQESGFATGVGEWRNEKDGVFGSYRLAEAHEEVEWDAYARGEGPLPETNVYRLAAE
jgi:hypothetical protein